MKKFLSFLMFFVIVVLVGCSPKETARFVGADYVLEVGSVPNDVCYIDGVPQILSMNSESDGDYTLSYIRDNGDVVLHLWALDPVARVSLQDGGEVFLSKLEDIVCD